MKFKVTNNHSLFPTNLENLKYRVMGAKLNDINISKLQKKIRIDDVWKIIPFFCIFGWEGIIGETCYFCKI